jgi:hypothetical protein
VKARALLTGSGEKKIVFVVFLGGITFTEIAALRFIAKKEEGISSPSPGPASTDPQIQHANKLSFAPLPSSAVIKSWMRLLKRGLSGR